MYVWSIYWSITFFIQLISKALHTHIYTNIQENKIAYDLDSKVDMPFLCIVDKIY
jgi:hypothetical protein